MYYNTTGISGEDLKEAVKQATSQEDAILLLYKTGKAFSPSDIFGMIERAGHKWVLTSVRRAITNLTEQNKLVKLSNMKTGLYGKPEHRWMISN